MIEGLRNAWKGLPLPAGARRAISPAIWGGLDRFFEMRLRRRPHEVLPGSVKVAGFFSESHGIAASAKRCAAALEDLGIDFETVDLGPLTHASLLKRPERGLAPGGAWIFHVNPPELVVALASIGASALAQSLVAGYWAWELPEAPPLWLRRKALVDEVWAPSAYTARALADGSATPVRVVPHPMGVTAEPVPTEAPPFLAWRPVLRLPSDKFIVTTLFDFRSSLARKNPFAAIAAFRKAFGDDPSVLLVIKTQHGHTAPALRAELKAAATAPNIRFIDEIWREQDAIGLIGSADVLLSLHRAEGFGLTLAEAMAMGTAVIATDWSGNVDFMRGYEGLVSATTRPVEDAQGIYAGQVWAEPNIDQAAALLQRLRTDLALRRSLAERGRALVKEHLSADSYLAAMGPAFRAAIGR